MCEARQELPNQIDVVISDTAVRDSMRMLLELHGYTMHEYSSGTEYILRADTPARCILTDRVLCDMSGFEFVEHLRICGEPTPAILMAGRIDPSMTSRAAQLVLTLLDKPPEPDLLLQTIQDICSDPMGCTPEGTMRDGPSMTAPARISRGVAREEERVGVVQVDWLKQSRTGVAAIDAEHQDLVETVFDFYDAVLAGEPVSALRELFDKLVADTNSHFAHEEHYMRFSDFPETQEHIAAHRLLQERLRTCVVLTEPKLADRTVVALDVMRFLKEWLMQHIRGEDQKLGAYLNTKNLR